MVLPIDEKNEGESRFQIELLATLRRRWEYVAFGLALGLSLALLYSFSTTPVFQSDIEILVGQRTSELTNSGTMTGASASGDAIQEDQLATHMRLLTARRVLAQAIEDGELRDVQSLQMAAARGINCIDHLQKNLTVKRGGDGTARNAMVLRASYRDPSATDAARVLNAVYQSYRTYVESHGENTSEQAVQLIEDARATHEQELASADREYREFIQSVPALFEGDRLQDIHRERLAKLEFELNLVRNQLAEQQSRLDVIENYLVANDSRTLDNLDHLALLSQKEVERLKLFLEMTRGEIQSESFQAEQPLRQEAARVQYSRLLELVQKERALSDAFGANHPLVDAARREIEITRQFLDHHAPLAAETSKGKLVPAEMLKTYTMLLRNDIAELEKRKAILLKDSEVELAAAKQVENDYMLGASLRAKFNRAQARYDQVILRLQELNLSRSYAGFSTDLLANPEPARFPAWPKLPILVFIGLFLGFGLGTALAVVAEMLDVTFNSSSDIEQATGATVIAHVPRFSIKKPSARILVTSSIAPSVVAFHSPQSPEAEIYRIARTSLLINNRREAVRTIMMTSPQPGDGKSTTIANLAVSLSRTGKKVLLIDADLRRPMISKLFGVPEQPGLADLLLANQPLVRSVHASDLANLHIMPHGRETSEPSELLESRRFQEILDEAKSAYDLILIDAPPLLAVADPAIIAPRVDSVIMTVRVCKNGRRVVEHAVKILSDIEVHPTAVIVNGVERSAQKSYVYSGYSSDPYGYVGKYHQRYSAAESQLTEASISA